MTREEMIDALIEQSFECMDLKALWYFFEHHQQEEFKDWTTEQITTEYKELIENE